jgi:hypothetical protein
MIYCDTDSKSMDLMVGLVFLLPFHYQVDTLKIAEGLMISQHSEYWLDYTC